MHATATQTRTAVNDSVWDLSIEATRKLKDCFDVRPEWQTADELTFDQATNLLDWLDNQQIQTRDLQMQDNGKMTVRWAI